MAAQAFLLIASFLLALFVLGKATGNGAGKAYQQRPPAGYGKR